METEKWVKEYQCPGCVGGSDTKCGKYRQKPDSQSCASHVAGTRMMSAGRLFLGMPKGFDRLGLDENTFISMFEDLKEMNTKWGEYDKFNVPVWKYQNDKGHVFVRGMHPRINGNFLHIFLNEITINGIECLQLTQKDVDAMD